MKRQTFNEINITPLTDIFLVLLIIMMVIAPILDQQGLSLAVPEYIEQKDVDQNAKLIEIAVTADNKYALNGNEIAGADLVSTIKEEYKTNTDGLLIQANGDAEHQTVVKLIDSARNAGVQSISIVEI